MSIPFHEHIRGTPVFWPLCTYLLGWLGAYLSPELFLIINIDSLGILLILLLISFVLRGFVNRWIQVILLLSSFFILGNLMASKNSAAEYLSESNSIYLTEVADSPIEKNKSILVKLKLIYCLSDSFYFDNDVFVNSYFEKAVDNQVLPEAGDQIIIKLNLVPVKNNDNPDEFDYAGWLKRKNIYFTSFVNSENWQPTSEKSNKFLYKCKSFRELLKTKIINYSYGDLLDEKAVLVAITLGTKDLLDRGIKSEFADAGAIHVMAVSGLHIGLIWMFIGFLTRFLKKNLAGRMLQFLIVLSLLWTYAFITGMSPSVTRSCLMFSMVSFGHLISRDSSVFNTVLLSAFMQLLFNPLLIFDAGFQFSYSAVLSILFFQPLLKKILFSRSTIINWFLDLISVSIAAQIFTFPLAIYYFHQFPVYFIFSNIVVIPLVTCLMIIFISALCFLMFPIIFQFFLSILLFISGLMIKSVDLISSLPFSTAGNLSINLIQMLLLLLSAIFLLVFINYKRIKYFHLSIIILLGFICLGILRFESRSTEKIIVFNVNNALALDIVYESKHYLIHDQDPIDIEEKLSFSAKNYWIKNYLRTPEFIHVDSLMNNKSKLLCQQLPGTNNLLISLGKTKIALAGEYSVLSSLKSDSLMSVNALIVFDPEFNSYSKQQSIFSYDKSIITPSCKVYSSWFSGDIGEYYFIRESGAEFLNVH